MIGSVIQMMEYRPYSFGVSVISVPFFVRKKARAGTDICVTSALMARFKDNPAHIAIITIV
jgi:hypothetical protein